MQNSTMDLSRLKLSRMSIRLDDSNSMPLYSRISIFANFDEETSKDDSLYEFLSSSLNRDSKLSNLSQFTKENLTKQKIKKMISYGTTVASSIDCKQLLQIITQQTADQLAIILSKTGIHKPKIYQYYTPEERFIQKVEYTLEREKPLKTLEQKMLKVQELIKAKIDEVIIFLYNILKDTGEEMRVERTYETLAGALNNIYRVKNDDFTILNMKAEELCAQLFHDIKRIEKEADRLLEGNRSIAFGTLREKDRVYFLNMKKMDYVEKWEQSRQWLHKYSCDKECQNVSNYIRDVEEKILKDEEVTAQVTTFLELDIEELERKRDEYPDKLDNECDMRTRVINQLKEELENMAIHKKKLAAEVKLRKKQMEDWKVYKGIKEAEEAELQRIAEEEELARQIEEERILAEMAAEEELLATFTSKERILYFKNKKKEAKRAAKEAKKAAKKKRRKA